MDDDKRASAEYMIEPVLNRYLHDTTVEGEVQDLITGIFLTAKTSATARDVASLRKLGICVLRDLKKSRLNVQQAAHRFVALMIAFGQSQAMQSS